MNWLFQHLTQLSILFQLEPWTRFARFSTKGIKKPPLEATPWSELAPPAAAKHTKAGTEEPTSTPMGKKNKGKPSADRAAPLVTTSTGKKKSKKNVSSRSSLPNASTDEIVHSELVPEESVEISPKMNGKKHKGSDKHSESPAGQSAKKKKKCLGEDATSYNGIEGDEDNVTAAELSKVNSQTTPPKKGAKRKSNENNLPKKKKKLKSINAEEADTPDASTRPAE